MKQNEKENGNTFKVTVEVALVGKAAKRAVLMTLTAVLLMTTGYSGMALYDRAFDAVEAEKVEAVEKVKPKAKPKKKTVKKKVPMKQC